MFSTGGSRLLTVLAVVLCMHMVQCGFKVYNGKKITNWSNNPFKFVVMLFGNSICTGSLLDAKTFLTAGHCLMEASAMPKYIALELTKVRGPVRKYAAFSSIKINPTYSWIYPHSDVNGKDVAVVKLKKSVINSKYDTVKVTVNYNTRPAIGTPIFMVGYGKDSYRGERAGILKAGKAVIQECRASFLYYEPICAVAQKKYRNRYIEQGDSGGPLLVKRNKEFVSVGVLSGFQEWDDGSRDMIYASTEHNADFIQYQLKN